MNQDIFSAAVEDLRATGFNPYPQPLHIQIPNARESLMSGLKYYLGNEAKWIPAYDEIADWLTDNKSRGLLCLGQCGLGKTLICSNIIPAIINHYMRYIVSTYNAQEMNDRTDEVLSRNILCIDDVGTESDYYRYGEHRNIFAEIADDVEKRGKLLIATSNLPTTIVRDKSGNQVSGQEQSLESRYGLRTLDRLRAVTRLVIFKGKSFRS